MTGPSDPPPSRGAFRCFTGKDANKKLKGRKRHLLCDTNGWLLALEITPADVQDRDGAKRCACVKPLSR